MEITEEQRKRAELNRQAALAKRKQVEGGGAWRLFKCRKFSPDRTNHRQSSSSSSLIKKPTQFPLKFRARLEICSPDSFSVTPLPAHAFPFPGEPACLLQLTDLLSNVVPSHYTQNTGGGKGCVYKLTDYNEVLRCLRACKSVECEEIPWVTFNVVIKLSDSFTLGRWMPCRPEHLSDDQVDELIERLPKSLVDALLPFQLEGVRFGLRRGGRCLIADEMGLGKTLQAIAIAACFLNDGSTLVVCPAVLRYAWAEEFERWLPTCLPSDIHLVFGHQDNPSRLEKCPRVVVTSYTMLKRLQKSMLEQDWAVLIVDESHQVRCTKRTSESEETNAVLAVARKAKHTVLLSGTPSLSRPYDIYHQINMLWPGLLGKDKYDFAKTYCSVKQVQVAHGKVFQDFSRGIRLEELNVLLKQTVMIRRLKEHVLLQLPPKRRQIIRLQLKKSDIDFANGVTEALRNEGSTSNGTEERSIDSNEINDIDLPDLGNEQNSCLRQGKSWRPDNGGTRKTSKELEREIGLAKLSGFCEWLSIHPIISELDAEEDTERSLSSHKMIIFGHYHKVLDKVQEFICDKGIEFIRIDGTTLARDRQLAVQSFQSSQKVKIALVGILAGGTGLNLSAAQNVVFLELPKDPSHFLQAEARAHRRGQTQAVNIYIFCAKDTPDESLWQKLNKSLQRVSSTVNGKYDAIHEIEIDSISYLGTNGNANITHHNPTSGSSSSTELSSIKLKELHTSCVEQKTEPDQASDLTGKGNDCYCDEQTNSGRSSPKPFTQNETENYDLDFGETILQNEGCSGNAFRTEVTEQILGRVSSQYELDGNKGSDTIEMVKNELKKTKLDNGNPVWLSEAAGGNSLQTSSLRFEVSQYTGRIHLYSCIPGVDSRPRALFENFQPEELESQHPPSDDSNLMDYKCIKDNPRYRHILLEFIRDWNNLKPIEQRKLVGKPLQIPLSVELCCLKESLNHTVGGLLKGKSKNRTTSLDVISHPLPPNAVWRKVSLSSGCNKSKKEYDQGWSLLDEPLCKLCQAPCKGHNANSPEYFEDLFCHLSCYEEYRLRTSSRFLREGLFQIEHGICTKCQLNCHKLVEHIRALSYEKREDYIKKVAPELAKRPKLLEKLVHEPTEGNAWHADHIVPVYLGGGECKLENMRTLCVVCHADVTAAQGVERRSMRLKAKKQLKAMLSDLKGIQNTDQNCAKKKDSEKMTVQESILEDDLLVEVPGSAYSEA